MHRAVPYLALLVVAILTGCGGGDGEGGAGTEAGAAPSGSLSVSASEFAFEPAELTAEAGEVMIELVNGGAEPHAIAVAGNGVDTSSETVDGGATTSLTVELDDGTYEIWCPVGDHRDRGMVGTLTVGAGGGTPNGETDTGESSDDSPRY